MIDPLCIFRRNAILSNGQETAECGLLQQVTKLTDPQFLTVPRSTCECCAATFPIETFLRNPVLPSLLYRSCDSALENPTTGATDRETVTQLESIRDWAEQVILSQQESAPSFVAKPNADEAQADGSASHSFQALNLPDSHPALGSACDVILCFDQVRASPEEHRVAVHSILGQKKVHPILHLVVSDDSSREVAETFSGWNVRIHQIQQATHPLSAAHELSHLLETPYLAVQYPHTISHPQRLAASLVRLIDEGADLLASPISTEQSLLFAQHPAAEYLTCLPTESLIIRRATFIDLGGVATGRLDLGTEFVFRASSGGYKFALSLDPLLYSSRTDSVETVGQPPVYLSQNVTKEKPLTTSHLRNHARGFRYQPVACDIVLPFHDHLDYTAKAIESLLAQEHADVVVHLVDDATPGEEVVEFLSHWSKHPNVRTYRNTKNLGQFTSFNNASQYFETDFAAVQDADDISLPHRIYEAVNLLNLTGAEFYGGAVELFGDEYLVTSALNVHETTRQKRQSHRYSCYPLDKRIDYFVENPTAVFRVNLFRKMGGYADFGSNLANRASLDTEFLCRCRYSQVPFAVSREVVTRYRVHANSATQNTLTGWGTGPRAQAAKYVEILCEKYRKSPFHPSQFGALGRYSDFTVPFVSR